MAGYCLFWLSSRSDEPSLRSGSRCTFRTRSNASSSRPIFWEDAPGGIIFFCSLLLAPCSLLPASCSLLPAPRPREAGYQLRGWRYLLKLPKLVRSAFPLAHFDGDIVS